MAQHRESRRVLFTFSPEAYEELGDLKKRLRAASKTEVIRLGMSVLSWIVTELESGHTVLVERKPKEALELAFPFLRVRPKKQKPHRT